MKKTIEQIFEIEPRLKEVNAFVDRTIDNNKHNPSFDAHEHFFGYHGQHEISVKNKFLPLVGHYCDKDELCNTDDYETVYQYFLNKYYALEDEVKMHNN